MKTKFITLTIFILSLLSVCSFAQTGEVSVKPVSSKIAEVTLYLNGAEIIRDASTEITKGVTVLKFSNLSRNIMQNSVQFIADKGLTILSVTLRDNYLAKNESSPELVKLEKKLDQTEDKIIAENAALSVINEDMEFLRANREISGENTTLTVASLQQLSEYYSSKVTTLKNKEITRKKLIKELSSQKDSLLRQINLMKAEGNQPAGEILVKVNSTATTSYKLRLSYVSENANWQPIYDIRAESIDKPLKLAYKALVVQKTGENWDNVTLRLSSSNPNLSGIIPVITPEYIRYLEFRAMNDALYLQEGGISANKEMRAPLSAYSPTLLRERQTSIEFEAVNKYSINSDGEKYSVDLGAFEMPATYKYYAVPKLDKDAFLVARVPDREKYNLLNGEASIFFEGRFVGTTYINTDNTSDTLDFSLGRDKGISITRSQILDFVSKKFIGSKKEETTGWQTIIRNNKNQNINIVIADQVPLSSISEIEVTIQNLSGGKLDSQTGEVKWELTLDPATKKQIDLQYTVKYPKNKTIVK